MSFNSYQLKTIALISMIIDHFAVVFQMYLSSDIYYILRGVGRLAFPIYCFLLVEGFFHTKNQQKYLLRLSIFSLISEIPYDLALHHAMDQGKYGLFVFSRQNVFFTLAIGFYAMMMLQHYYGNSVMTLIIILTSSYVAEFLCCDYGAVGVITILLFYIFRRKTADPKAYQRSMILCFLPLLLTSLSEKVQLVCIVSYVFICLYNQEKGRGPKYLFYLAYPAHLLLFFMIRSLI